jgi:hypothetical protein
VQPAQNRTHLAVRALVAKLDILYFEKAVEDAFPRVDFYRFHHQLLSLKFSD